MKRKKSIHKTRQMGFSSPKSSIRNVQRLKQWRSSKENAIQYKRTRCGKNSVMIVYIERIEWHYMDVHPSLLIKIESSL